MYVYSQKNNAFYIIDNKALYEISGAWPDDGVSVSNSVYDEFAASIPPDGKVRMAGSDGLPCWGDIPEATKEEIIAIADAQKIYLLNRAQQTISIWQTELQLGIITNTDKTKLIAWLAYIKKLNLINTALAPNIEWPVEPELGSTE
ncbi:tail fiber assembly protein [Budviciaceae bacterium CWB-B4]|uniref:Tail fiber assembly protein n=1 Tax=Limnobaculum xujianqingii TaxID=2738837 RepID=A0A9D7G0B8_9GAMM|nr:tail fiber assembly protein [Limnobaculum xujianqingii]MBK5075079.1 tail fiber assembly protein [Limnobaculum xujianqingii]MBK5178386.1 tail fiber assembly protein [Limnobaculum xujianqingii]